MSDESSLDKIKDILQARRSIICHIDGFENMKQNGKWAIIDYDRLVDTEYFLCGHIGFALQEFRWFPKKELAMLNISEIEVSELWRFKAIHIESYPYVQTNFTDGRFVRYGEEICVDNGRPGHGIVEGTFPEPAG